MSTFKNKVVIITGAGSGIGRGLSLELIRRGALVTACDINEKRLEELSESIHDAAGSRLSACRLDVTDYDAVKKVVDDTVAAHGRLDYVFNNAGIGIGGEARDISIDDWRAVLDVNLNGVVNGVAAAYPFMAAQGFGHVVNTSSFDGLVPGPGHIAYTTSKFGVMGLSYALRMEAALHGVKVSVVCPGRVETPIFETSKMVGYDREKAMKVVNSAPGISVEKCVKTILRGVEKNEEVIIPSDYVRVLWRLERIAPRLVHNISSQVLKSPLNPRVK